jgi:hypothetical protein
MHIFGKFCGKNLTLVIKKQFSRATKGLSQDGDEIHFFSDFCPGGAYGPAHVRSAFLRLTNMDSSTPDAILATILLKRSPYWQK